MNATRRPRHERARWMAVVALCGALLGFGIPVQAAEQPIGTVLGVPMWELDAFVRANALPGVDHWANPLPANNVAVLHVSPEFNSAIVTVAVTRRATGAGAPSVYFPTFGNGSVSPVYRQINADDAWSSPRIFGENLAAVVEVGVVQSPTGSYTPGRTRFLLVPGDTTDEILALNAGAGIHRVHRQRARIGAGDLVVDLLAIDAGGRLATDRATVRLPVRPYGLDLARMIRSLNSNVDLQGLTIITVGATSMNVGR